jgi:hypothetical protein
LRNPHPTTNSLQGDNEHTAKPALTVNIASDTAELTYGRTVPATILRIDLVCPGSQRGAWSGPFTPDIPGRHFGGAQESHHNRTMRCS